jgi:hypothetical protein
MKKIVVLLSVLVLAPFVVAQKPSAINANQIRCPAIAVAPGASQPEFMVVGKPVVTGLGTFILFTCVQVDAATLPLDLSTTPPTQRGAGGTGGPVFVGPVIPAGAQDGVNLVFTLPDSPNPQTGLQCIRNGLVLTAVIGASPPVDFTLAGATMTFVNAAATPQPGDSFSCTYRK